MPKLDAFPGVSQGWVNLMLAISSAAVKDAIEEGADFMRDAIMDSPTSHPWHLRKNAANNFPSGARIGNRVIGENLYEIDPNSGKMLASVASQGPLRSGSNSEVLGLFGWLNTQEDYFLDQDSGAYNVGAAMGMGLLNAKAPGAGGVLRKYGATMAAKESLIKSLKASGLKHNDLGGE
jgi:hypothetical protein